MNIAYAHPTMVSSLLQKRVPAVPRMVDILKTGKSDLSKEERNHNKNWQAKDPQKENSKWSTIQWYYTYLARGIGHDSQVLKGPTMSLRFRGDKKRIETKNHCVE